MPLGSRAPPCAATLAQRAERATAAYAAFARYLADEYSAHADAPDAVGPERYSLFSRSFNGIDLDLAETYAWGWDELYRIEHAMGEVGERILPATPLARGHRAPRVGPEPRDRRRRCVPAPGSRTCMDTTIAELDGTHFDIPEPVKAVEAMIAPPGGAAAMYYTGPIGGLQPAGAHLVPDARQDALPALG